MSFAPDFGMRLLRDGASHELDIHLVPFELDHISIVGDGMFTTMSNLLVDEKPHAVSLDFDARILQAIAALCSDEMARFIEEDLAVNGFAGYTLELPQPVVLAVTARLGEIQIAEQERYVPLVVQNVSALSA